ncbi:MAG TPA: DsbA family protein [Candidatus Dormibacteraeota bacterium]|nr:DsbA family protein [Candidatus Dormibacteraeota bacterium]
METFSIRLAPPYSLVKCHRDLGPPDAPLVLAFGDVFDPGYRAVLPVLEALVREGAARVRYIHYAAPAGFDGMRRRETAAALEAAGRQGAFWPYHRLLLTGTISLNRAGLAHRARFLGLDVDRFERDLASADVVLTLESDAQLADDLDVHHLPALVIGGRRYDGGMRRSDLHAALSS